MIRLLPLVLIFSTFAACISDADRVVPPSGTSTEALSIADERERALNAALDTLETLVITLEGIKDPMTAWNKAKDASRLLRALERDQASFALGSEEEAARQYPEQIDRLKRLESRRDIELNRIMEDRVTAQVFIEVMNEMESEN